MFGLLGDKPADGTIDNQALWAQDAQRWNVMLGAALNAQREPAGLALVGDVRRHIFTDAPWLAADPILAPWPEASGLDVLQTRAWTLTDDRLLPPELEEFLDAGEPPIYFGFGSVRAPEGIARTMIAAARALGRRAVLARGWAGISLDQAVRDCLVIEEVNQQALFRRVAAVVHHGGAGTTAAAAAGTPQVLVPQMFDQFYFAHCVDELQIGSAHPGSNPTAGSLTTALRRALAPRRFRPPAPWQARFAPTVH